MVETLVGLRDLTVVMRPVSEVRVRPKNARTHSKGQVRAIANSIATIGFLNPVLVDDSGMVLAGHGRLAAAKLMGANEIPTLQASDLSEAQKRAFVLADNRLAERAGWDRETLAIELGELSVLLPELGIDVSLTGFEVGEVDVILADHEENKAAETDDDVGPLPVSAATRPGDLWVLGRHRMICGDARDPEVLRTVLRDEPVDVMVSDPPYNVRIRDIVGRGQTKYAEFAMASGEMSEEQFQEFLSTVLANAIGVSRDGAVHFVFIDWRHVADLVLAGKGLYGDLLNICAWTKSNGGQGSLYRSAHELVAVFKVGEGTHVNNVQLGRYGRNRTNVWAYPGVNGFKAGRDTEFASHPTPKPVALVADAIKDVTARGAIVLDLFGGSGTTLIAAERTGRRARLVEIEPRFVDVAIRRFEEITKADAVLESTGVTFAELACTRSERLN